MSACSGTSYDIKIAFKGSAEKIALFNRIIGEYDQDWAYRPEVPKKKCKVCGGIYYRLPRFKIGDLKALESQIAGTSLLKGRFKIKIHGWKDHSNCIESWVRKQDHPPTEGVWEVVK